MQREATCTNRAIQPINGRMALLQKRRCGCVAWPRGQLPPWLTHSTQALPAPMQQRGPVIAPWLGADSAGQASTPAVRASLGLLRSRRPTYAAQRITLRGSAASPRAAARGSLHRRCRVSAGPPPDGPALRAPCRRPAGTCRNASAPSAWP